MSLLKICLVQFLNGFKDSLIGFIKFIQNQKKLQATLLQEDQKSKKQNQTILRSNEKLYQRLIQSCILNGVFLFFCICTFNFFLIPVLNWFAFKLISESNHNLIYDYLNPIIQILFSSVWILPVFLLSKIFNVLCHQEIADIAYSQKYGKPQIFQNFSIAQVIADTVFSCTMELIFLVQSSIMGLIPSIWLNNLLSHIHLSFLYSLYAFEYKLCNMSWDIKKRIHHIESRWPYYFGFGLSLSLLLSLAGSYIYSATLFAFVFPAYILSAIESDSEKLPPVVYLVQDQNEPNGFKYVQFQVPLFKFSIYLTDLVFKFFAKKKSNTAPNNPSQNQNKNFTIRKTN